MIDREYELPITRQAEALNISRGSVYYLPRPVPDADLTIMQRLDRCIWSSLLLALACCEGCWLPMGARSAVGM
jgi:putative transposase